MHLRSVRLTDVFDKASEKGIFVVRNHPLLDVIFKYKRDKSLYTPVDNFSGLIIHAAHSGSEGFVELLEFKPEMDAYLHSIGIDYEDLSRTNL